VGGRSPAEADLAVPGSGIVAGEQSRLWPIVLLRSVLASCIFCEILRNRQGASQWIAESDRAFALLDIHPLRRGHTLVIPKFHAAEFAGLPSEYMAAIIDLARDVAARLRRVLGTTGENILAASGPGSEQAVPHFHLHVVPRHENDDLRWNDWWESKVVSVPDGEQVALARDLRGRG